MNPLILQLLQIVLTAALCLGLSAYLRPHLHRILLDLCGTEARARFWSAFTDLTLVLIPVLFSMGPAGSSAGSMEAAQALVAQLRLGLFGFIGTLTAVGVVITFFAVVAPRQPMRDGG